MANRSEWDQILRIKAFAMILERGEWAWALEWRCVEPLESNHCLIQSGWSMPNEEDGLFFMLPKWPWIWSVHFWVCANVHYIISAIFKTNQRDKKATDLWGENKFIENKYLIEKWPKNNRNCGHAHECFYSLARIPDSLIELRCVFIYVRDKMSVVCKR